MDVIPFIVFSVNKRYIARWIGGGALLFIPIANFLSLGYLSRCSTMFAIGGIGMPTWEKKDVLWKEGAKLLYILILYEAVPSFFFSCAFLLSSFGNFITLFMAGVFKFLAAVAFLVCTLFVPFAFCAYSESLELRKAFEFERIIGAVKGVLPQYVVGYLLAGVCLYVAFRLLRIPYLVGFFLSSIVAYYIMLVATFYYTQLFKRTELAGRARE